VFLRIVGINGNYFATKSINRLTIITETRVYYQERNECYRNIYIRSMLPNVSDMNSAEAADDLHVKHYKAYSEINMCATCHEVCHVSLRHLKLLYN
jgi:hypothetical protein